MTTHLTGTRDQWLAARLELLAQEKELTRRSDELAQRRQALPWVRHYPVQVPDCHIDLCHACDCTCGAQCHCGGRPSPCAAWKPGSSRRAIHKGKRLVFCQHAAKPA